MQYRQRSGIDTSSDVKSTSTNRQKKKEKGETSIKVNGN